jgi:hypothetical protein
MGLAGSPFPWPDLDPVLGKVGAYLYPWVLLATLPAVMDFHRSRGIPESVSVASLEDLGRQLTIARKSLGRGGLLRAEWLTLHFRAALFELGRLQFQCHQVTRDNAAAVFPDVTQDLPALSVHIPATGRLHSDGVDASFAMAADFFGRHFSERGYRHAVCHSWLLDPQLAEYLPPDSNIMRFQRRFALTPGPAPDTDDDAFVVSLVFNRKLVRGAGLDALPQDTTLQRAIVGHLRAGRHWYFRDGWCDLP